MNAEPAPSTGVGWGELYKIFYYVQLQTTVLQLFFSDWGWRLFTSRFGITKNEKKVHFYGLSPQIWRQNSYNSVSTRWTNLVLGLNIWRFTSCLWCSSIGLLQSSLRIWHLIKTLLFLFICHLWPETGYHFLAINISPGMERQPLFLPNNTTWDCTSCSDVLE